MKRQRLLLLVVVVMTASNLVPLPTAAAAVAPLAGTFVSLPPARVLDSRVGNGFSGAVPASGTVALQVAGRGGVPASGAAAVVLNTTVTETKAPGFITVFPSDVSLPVVSNLNFGAGQTVPNLVTVKLGPDGKVNLFNSSSQSVALIADVAGYYVAGTPGAAGAFVSLPPARVLDSRVGNGFSGAVPASGTVALQVAGRGGVPASGAAAVVLNTTVTETKAPGFITVFPSDVSLPVVSNLNFGAGQTVPNLVTVKLGPDGKVNLFNSSSQSVALIADVAGYYLAASASAAPTITGITPATGDVAGGTVVTITGTNLSDATQVTFGGVAATSVTSVSESRVTAVAPAHAAGSVEVELATPGGVVRSPGAFAYTVVLPDPISLVVPLGQSATVSTGAYSIKIPAGALTTDATVSVTPLQPDIGMPRMEAHIDGQWSGTVTVTLPAMPAEAGAAPVVVHDAVDGVRISSGTAVTTGMIDGQAVVSTQLTSLSTTASSTSDCGRLGDGQKALKFLCQDNHDALFQDWANAQAVIQGKSLANGAAACGSNQPKASAIGSVPFGVACTIDVTGTDATFTFTNNVSGQAAFWTMGAVFSYETSPAGSFTSQSVAFPTGTILERFVAQLLPPTYLVPNASLQVTKALNSPNTSVNISGSVPRTAEYEAVLLLVGQLGDDLMSWGATQPAIMIKFSSCVSIDATATRTACLLEGIKYLLNAAVDAGESSSLGAARVGAKVLGKIFGYADLGAFILSLTAAVVTYNPTGTTTLINRDTLTAIAVTAGQSHSCALDSGGWVYCWGKNRFGELGDGSTIDRSEPVRVQGLMNVIAISAGLEHTCAIVVGGSVYCWGDNQYGQLSDSPSNLPFSTSPIQILSGVTKISAGQVHTCGVLQDGKAACWGSNWWGQLGDGTRNDSYHPIVVSGLAGVTSVTAGDAHSCAVIAAGSVTCWGRNLNQQLGDGTTVDHYSPEALVAGVAGATEVDAGNLHTCALLGSGDVKCWGDNFYGALGDGTRNMRSGAVTVQGLSNVNAIAAEGGGTCTIVQGGLASCWGYGVFDRYTPQPSPLFMDGLAGVTSIARGEGHTCAVSGGSVLCWGVNEWGQLGDGSLVDIWAPIHVFGFV